MKKFLSPNAITVARIVLIPFGVYAIFKNGGDDSTWQIIAWCIYFVLGLSDMLDGHLARATNQVSELGKFLDPVADKALIGSAMISLSILGRFPWWITAVILAREIGISSDQARSHSCKSWGQDQERFPKLWSWLLYASNA